MIDCSPKAWGWFPSYAFKTVRQISKTYNNSVQEMDRLTFVPQDIFHIQSVSTFALTLTEEYLPRMIYFYANTINIKPATLIIIIQKRILRNRNPGTWRMIQIKKKKPTNTNNQTAKKDSNLPIWHNIKLANVVHDVYICYNFWNIKPYLD